MIVKDNKFSYKIHFNYKEINSMFPLTLPTLFFFARL